MAPLVMEGFVGAQFASVALHRRCTTRVHATNTGHEDEHESGGSGHVVPRLSRSARPVQRRPRRGRSCAWHPPRARPASPSATVRGRCSGQGWHQHCPARRCALRSRCSQWWRPRAAVDRPGPRPCSDEAWPSRSRRRGRRRGGQRSWSPCSLRSAACLPSPPARDRQGSPRGGSSRRRVGRRSDRHTDARTRAAAGCRRYSDRLRRTSTRCSRGCDRRPPAR